MSTVKLEIKGNFLKITDNINNNDEILISGITKYFFTKGDTVLNLRTEQATNQITYKYNVDVLVDDSDTPFVSLVALEDFLSENLGGVASSGGSTMDEKIIASSIIGQKQQSWLPYGASFTTVGVNNPSLIGAGSNLGAATSINVYDRWNKRRQTAAAIAGTPFGAYTSNIRTAFIGNGFYNTSSVAYNIGSDNRMFVGLSSSLADIGNVDISTLTNIIGVGKDVADTNLQIIHNDAAGIATKIDLGSDFSLNPTKSTPIVSEFICDRETGQVYYRVVKLATTDSARFDTGYVEITTDLPDPTTGLAAKIYGNTGTEAAARYLEFNYMNLYV